MGFVKTRGRSFYYEEQGEGQPILLIPPSGSTASTWGALPSDLARAGRVIAYDHRMAFYGDPSPRLIALVDKIGVDAKWFTLLQALEPASAH